MKNSTTVRTSPKKQKNASVKNTASASTKATSSLMGRGFLSQDLIVQKEQKLPTKQTAQKQSKKNSLFDLQQTLNINIEILKNFFTNRTSAMTLLNQDKPILDCLEKFIAKYNKKKEIIKKIKEKKSKNLIQLQIYFEIKRKLQETLNNCKDALFDAEDAVDNKDEYVKLFQKKFVEVEIYLQRVTADMEDEKRRKYYQSYKMDNFINLSTTLSKKKEKLKDDINKYKAEKKRLNIENKNIKIEENLNMEKKDKKEKSRDQKDESIMKKNEMIQNKYKMNIHKKTAKLNLLKKFMNNYCNIDKVLNNNKIPNKKKNVNEIKEEDNNPLNQIEDKKKITMFKKLDIKQTSNNERTDNGITEGENEKSILPFEMTKRMNSFMDFSVVLNDNSKLRDSLNSRKNISKIAWGDVSAIERNDDF